VAKITYYSKIFRPSLTASTGADDDGKSMKDNRVVEKETTTRFLKMMAWIHLFLVALGTVITWRSILKLFGSGGWRGILDREACYPETSPVL
jgi:hypothetical protein